MAKLRVLVNRRKAIRNIRKITRTMELIATARFKKAFDRAVEAEAYTRKIGELAADLSASATAGRLARVEVGSMKCLNAARQKPVVETLLPLARPATDERKTAARPVEYEFLPGAGDILEELLPVSFKVRLFKCFLDAAVSEQIARRVTMKAATENADQMIKTLTRKYNRARQAQITKEIAEVIGGAGTVQ